MAHLTIPRLFETAAERAPTKEWLFYEDEVYTYERARGRIGAATAALRELGIERETIVMATMRNSADCLLTWLALMQLGAVLLPVNPKATAAELGGFARQAEPRLVLIDADLRPVVEKGLREASSGASIALIGDLFSGENEAAVDAARPDDLAVLIPTSGTTGRSKLVMQTQRAYAMAGEGFPFWVGVTSDDRLMTSLPLFHINAPAYSALGSAAAGAGLVLLPGFSARRFFDQARRYGGTEFNAIGAMLEILMRQPEREDDADNPLRLCYTGPAPPKQRQLEIERRFGLEIMCGYALSETPYALSWKRGTRPFGTLGSVRQHPVLGEINRARVRDDQGRIVGSGESGELELSNPAVMLGYYGMPAETRQVLVEGWLRTGDLVRVNDDGTYTFIARRKEVIRRRGENLSPLEVEGALEAHPAVVEAAVIGVPSELTEEDVKAFVVLGDKTKVSAAELREWVADRLTPFKAPRYLEVMKTLPHTPTGRVVKHELPRGRSEGEVDLGPQTASPPGANP